MLSYRELAAAGPLMQHSANVLLLLIAALISLRLAYLLESARHRVLAIREKSRFKRKAGR